MTIEIPEWAYKVDNYPVHTEPARTGGDILPPFTWQQMQEYFAQFMNAFLAQVAIALGGIEIAGWKPFEFLAWWGQQSLQSGDPLNAADLIGLIAEQLIPGLDATKIISGLFPQSMVANLEDDLNNLWDSILAGDVQGVIDAITGLTGGTVEELAHWSTSLLSMLGLPDLNLLPFDPVDAVVQFITNMLSPTDFFGNLSSMLGMPSFTDFNAPGFDLIAAIEAFITNLLQPTNLLAPLDPFSLLIDTLHVPGLDATKITSGEFPQTMITGLGDSLDALLGPDGPLNALNLFNLVPTDLMSHIPMSNIGEFVTNMVTDPTFQDVEGFDGGGIWTINPTAGFGGLGGVFTTAIGVTQELLGNLIPVSEGQVLPFSGMARWAGLAGTGNPIQLAITAYKDGTATLQSIIASHNTIPPTTDWVTLAGTFTVPANVDHLRTRLVVGSTATAGTVGFSNLSVTKTGAMLQRLIQGTNVGEFLPNDITHLFNGIVSNASAILDRALQGDFEGLVTTIEGDIQSGFEEVGNRLNSFLDHLSPLNGSNINAGTIADTFVPGIGDILDTTVTNVQNIVGSGFTYDSLAQGFAAQTNSIVSSASHITEMLARLGNLESQVSAIPPPPAGTPPGSGNAFGGAVGVYDSDDFERTSTSSLGANWIQSYKLTGSGTWATSNGHDAGWILGSGDREFLAIRSGAYAKTATDYQQVTTVVSSAPTRFYDALLGTYNYVGHNDIWLRVSDSTTSIANVTGTRLRFGADGSLSIIRFSNGSPVTTLASKPAGSITPPGPGAILIGEAGNIAGAGTPQYFRGIVGNSMRIDGTDLGGSYGSTFRRWGHGGRAEGHLLPLPGQEKPGSLHYTTGADQTTSSTGAPGQPG